MSDFDMFDPMVRELDEMRARGEAEERKHNCEGCRDRIGIPCLIAKSCKRWKEEGHEAG